MVGFPNSGQLLCPWGLEFVGLVITEFFLVEILGEVVEVQSPVATVFYSCSVQGLLQGVPLG